MITAVDSNVLLDVFVPDPTFGPLSRDALRRCLSEGGLVACDVVWAEVSATFSSSDLAARTLETLGVTFAPLDMKAAALAGDAWRSYRRRGGERERVIADFLVGAHARSQADRLLTRDRGFYRSAFSGLNLVEPTAR